MTREEIVEMFQTENPEITTRVISNALLADWLEVGDKDVCARTRCIVDQGTTIATAENDESWVLTDEVTRFYDINEFPGGGVTYNAKRLQMTTIPELDMIASNWRGRSAGTPTKYYRQGNYLYVDRPIDSNAYTLKIYSVLIPSDFDADTKTPYDQLTYLEPYHYGLVKWLNWKAKAKIGKPQEALVARQEYLEYIEDMKLQLGGGKFGKVFFRKRETA